MIRARSDGFYKYKLFRYDQYKKVVRIQYYKRGIQFFSNFANNLHRHEIYLQTQLNNQVSEKKWMKNGGSYITLGIINLWTLRQLNGSVRLVLFREVNKYDINIKDEYYACGGSDIFLATVAPPLPRAAYFMTPCFYDEKQHKYYGILITSLAVIFWTIFSFYYYAKKFRFDQLTWEPTIVFSMIISIANPRNPVNRVETALFRTLVVSKIVCPLLALLIEINLFI